MSGISSYDTYMRTVRDARTRLGENTIVAFGLALEDGKGDDYYHILQTEDDESGATIHRVAEIWGQGQGPPVLSKDAKGNAGRLEIQIPVAQKRQMVDVFRTHGYHVIVVPRLRIRT